MPLYVSIKKEKTTSRDLIFMVGAEELGEEVLTVYGQYAIPEFCAAKHRGFKRHVIMQKLANIKKITSAQLSLAWLLHKAENIVQ